MAEMTRRDLLRAAAATADAADRFMAATRRDAASAHVTEDDALAAERSAQATHQAALDRGNAGGADDHAAAHRRRD